MEPTPEARNWAAIAHFSALVLFIGIPSLIGPLVVWLLRKDQDEFIDANGKEALNFNISFLLYAIAAGLLILIGIGLILLPVVAIAWFVLVIVAGVKAGSGEYYTYPFTIRFIN
jgi:uncharacterized Tic20 family protein